MPGNHLRYARSRGSGGQVRVSIAACQTRVLTRWARAAIAHWCRYLVLLAAIAAFSAIGATVAEDQSHNRSPIRFVCTASPKENFVSANGSWQEVSLDGTDNNFTAGCAINVNFSLNEMDELSGLDTYKKVALLVRLYRLQFHPAEGKCSYGNLTLEIQALRNTSRRMDVCNIEAAEALYILVSEPIRLYLFVWSSPYYRASFSAAFIALRFVDVCQLFNIPRIILPSDSSVQTIAPHVAIDDPVTNSTTCFNCSETLLAAVNLFSTLDITPKAVPQSRSCWSVWLAFLRMNDTGVRSFVPSANVTLLYAFDNSTISCNSTEPEPVFTRKLNAVSAVTEVSTMTTAVSAIFALLFSCTRLVSVVSTSTSTTPIISTSPTEENRSPASSITHTSVLEVAVGSSVAAVAAVAALTLAVTLLVIRSRRIRRHHNSFNRSSHHSVTSVLGLENADAHTSVSNEQSIHLYGARPQDSPALAAAAVGDSSRSVATTICTGDADVAMVDNELYSRSFGI